MILYDKINQRLNTLQAQMESNTHLSDPDTVQETIESISKFWSVLTEEDRDYVHCAQYALEEKHPWNIE